METYQNGQQTVTPPIKKQKKGWLIFVIITVAIILVAIILGIALGEKKSYIPTKPYIGTLYVEGTIGQGETDLFGTPIGYQHQWTLDKLDQLMEDKNNKGLVIFVDSPGGGVYESDELYLKLKEYKERTNRPMYAVMGSMAASGGYYISAPADKIFANRNTLTGSIGVTMGTYFDISGLLSRYGINTVTITSGNNKAMGSMVAPMTEEQQAIMQSLANESYDQFTGIVARERGLDIARVKQLADGRIYTAKQALNVKLIDQIGTLEDAISDMKDLYGLEKCNVRDLHDEESSLFGSLVNSEAIEKMLGIGRFQNGDVAALLNVVQQKSQFPISYMYEGYFVK